MVESRVYDLDLIFHALADPTRRAMLNDLGGRELTISELAQPFDMSLAAASKHIRALERARLVHRRRDGSSFYLRLDSAAMLIATQWLAESIRINSQL